MFVSQPAVKNDRRRFGSNFALGPFGERLLVNPVAPVDFLEIPGARNDVGVILASARACFQKNQRSGINVLPGQQYALFLDRIRADSGWA